MMKQKTFLQQVADYYLSKTGNGDLADIIFILPNKRSAIFLKSYIKAGLRGEFCFMPRFTTFGKFIARRSGLRDGSRNDRLFILYHAYRKVLARHGRDAQTKDFDKFIFWGDMILSDFDTIDSSLASAEQLYRNLHDLRMITADYLTEEQKSVIREIWGETSMTESVETFWLHTGHGEDHSQPMTKRFLALWQILGEVYDQFVKDMTEAGISTSGIQARRAVEVVKNESPEVLRRNRYVFVGHSDLSTAEIHIMQRLKDIGSADFFWDTAGEIFKDRNLADDVFEIIKRLEKRFPVPEDFSLEQITTVPDIEIVGISSAVGQAKHAAGIINEWVEEGIIDPMNAIDTAVVLPDQKLLMPMVLGLPEKVKTLNVSMTVPYSSTTFATLLRIIISLQMRARKRSSGEYTFFYRDVLEVLQHPHINLIAPEEAERIRRDINRKRLYNIDASYLVNAHSSLAYIFEPVGKEARVEQVYAYTERLLRGLRRDIVSSINATAERKSHEIEVLGCYRLRLDELYENIRRYDIKMHESTFFILFERILDSDMLGLNGTPLRGLQVMGVLETRDLDFENIVILSMNERTFPRRDYVRTMIPNNLRRGYGLPPIERTEGYYAYYFFRAISRARRVRLLYDSRPGNRGGGEISRYLSQLIYLHDRGNISHLTAEMGGLQPAAREIEIIKSPRVMDELRPFLEEGGLNISASSLKSYMKCPLSFYLTYVKGLREDEEPEGYITPAQQGNILHLSMKQLYEPWEGKRVDAAVIDSILDGDRIERVVMKNLYKEAFNSDKVPAQSNQTFEAELNGAIIARQVRMLLEAEKECYCSGGSSFVCVKGEMDFKNCRWEVVPGLKINFRMLIDRVDRIDEYTLRFIDYKTGKDELSTGGCIDNLFNPVYKGAVDGIFQLLTYAEAYRDLTGEHNVIIQPAIHALRKIAVDGEIKPLYHNRAQMEPFPALSGEFRPRLNAVISEIFNPEVPFSQSLNKDVCRYCKFHSMCGRVEEPVNFSD